MYNYLFYFLPKYLNKLLFHIQTCYGCITNRARPPLVETCTPCSLWGHVLPLRQVLEDSWTALILCYWPAFKNMFIINSITVLAYTERRKKLPKSENYEDIQSDHQLPLALKKSIYVACVENFSAELCFICTSFTAVSLCIGNGFGCIFFLIVCRVWLE